MYLFGVNLGWMNKKLLKYEKNKDKETDYINDRITTHKITKHNKTRIALDSDWAISLQFQCYSYLVHTNT